MQLQCLWRCHRCVPLCWHQNRTDTPTRGWSQEHGSTAPQSKSQPEQNKKVSFEVKQNVWTKGYEKKEVRSEPEQRRGEMESAWPLQKTLKRRRLVPSSPIKTSPQIPLEICTTARGWGFRKRDRERFFFFFFLLLMLFVLVLFCLGLCCWYHTAGWRKQHASPFSLFLNLPHSTVTLCPQIIIIWLNYICLHVNSTKWDILVFVILIA